MIEAAGQTNTSTVGIWVIAIVAVAVLAFWLTSIFVADRSQARASGRARMAGELGAPSAGVWAGGSVAGGRAPEIPAQAVHEPAGTPAGHTRPGDTPTRADIPVQRAGAADRPQPSYTGPGGRDEDGPGR